MIEHSEEAYESQLGQAYIETAEFSKDNRYLIIHLLKTHAFDEPGWEIHEFVILKADGKWLNNVKV